MSFLGSRVKIPALILQAPRPASPLPHGLMNPPASVGGRHPLGTP